MKQTYTFFSIKTQFENLGDALINREMVINSSKHSKCVVDVSRCPDYFVDTLELYDKNNIELVRYGLIYFFIKMINISISGSQVYYFLSPGGYFGNLNIFSFIKNIIQIFILFFVKIFGVRVVQVGVSYERLGFLNLLNLKLRSLLYYKHFLRDEVSMCYLNAKKIKCDMVADDLAFSYSTIPCADSVLRDSILFSFRCDQDSEQYEHFKAIVTSAHREVDKSLKFVFYVQVQRDYEYAKCLLDEFTSKYSNERHLDIVNCSTSFHLAANAFLHGKEVHSNRLHVILLASLYGVKPKVYTFSGFNQKIKGLFGSAKPFIDIEDISNEIKFSPSNTSDLGYSEWLAGRKENLLHSFDIIYGAK